MKLGIAICGSQFIFFIFETLKQAVMSQAENSLMLPEETIISKIYMLRGKKVMIDRDLAELYDVETRVLNQAVGAIKNVFRKILCSR